MGERGIDVLATGPLVLVQDTGRPGYAALGVGHSGAADRSAHRLANRLVANPDRAATLEILLGGLVIQAREPLVVAITGALSVPRINGAPGAYSAPMALAPGDILDLAPPEYGLRTCLAVAGGWVAPRVLGSASTDTLSRLGPGPVTRGARLGVGAISPARAAAAAVGARPPGPGTVCLEVLAGPRRDWLADPDALLVDWTVSGQSDRVGTRLDGTPLAWARSRVGVELSSEGVVRGAIQVPPSGLPVIFGPDHPVTGGYPVVGVLTEASSDALAQVRAGTAVRLRAVDRVG
ncbi:MAG: biotin-dependent carboxyltransferase family protein [Propioniciclava sp.]